MNEELAKAIVDDVRRFTDALCLRLRELEGQASPDEYKAWQTRVGRALGPLDEILLRPVEALHPNAVPTSMGGVGPLRPLARPE